MSAPTTGQTILLSRLGVTDGDGLWALLHEDRKSDNVALVGVAERIQRHWWDVEQAERDYAGALSSLAANVTRQTEGLEQGQRPDPMWIVQASEKAEQAAAAYKIAVDQFLTFVHLRAAIHGEA